MNNKSNQTTRMLFLLVSILLVAGIIAGCSNDNTNDADDTKSATLLGVVTDSSTGAYVTGVTISVGTLEGVSDGNGKYMVTNIEPGKHTLTASKSNYQEYTTPIEVLDGTNTLNITLTPLELQD